MVVGERPSKILATGYEKNPMFGFVNEFTNVAQSFNESTDLYLDPRRALNSMQANEALKNFFVNESCDEENMTPEEIEEHVQDMEALYENDREGILENMNMSEVSPIIGMTFPLHKWILMNMVFDKGGIPKFVAQSPKFTISQETRILVDTEGNEIDMFKQQNEMTAAIDKTINKTVFDVTLPLTEETEIVHDKVGGLAGADHLAIETRVCAIKVADVYFEVGDILPNEDGYIVTGNKVATEAGNHDVWVPVDYLFVPGYYQQDYDRAFMKRFNYEHKIYEGGEVKTKVTSDSISGTMKKDRLTIASLSGNVTEVRVEASLDPSNARATTCSVSWRADTTIVEIGNAIPINTTISPEEVKDINALYNVNQVTKIMSLMKTALGNYKDDKIKQNLDASYDRLELNRDKTYNQFDFSPRVGYGDSHVAWIKDTFLFFLDQEVTVLLQYLNDPNMTVSIYGDPAIVRQITPATYAYAAPGTIGPVELDYTKVVYTSDKRVYNFIGSDKLRNTNQLMLILCPNGTDRILYRIYDYQLYLSNEIRNANNPALPALHSFERWKFVEYTPVQGRIDILNPRGINSQTYNAFPVKHQD